MTHKPVSEIPMSNYIPPPPAQKPKARKENEQPSKEDYIKFMVDKHLQLDRLRQNIIKDNYDNNYKFDWYSFCIGLAVAFLIIGVAAIIHPPCQ